MRILLFYAFLACGLLLDGAYLFRLLLLCAAVHEAGHVLGYLVCTHKLPTLCFSAGGVSLKRTALLSKQQELLVLMAGPGANLLLAALLYVRAQQKASYGIYFLAAVSICVCAYNLLPFGVLDGARLLHCLVPAKHLSTLLRVQQWLLIAFCSAMPLCAMCLGASPMLKVAAFVAPAYLLVQNTFS